MVRHQFSPKKRNDLLTAYAGSGLTIKQYAAANGIGYSTIQRWLRNHKTAYATDTVFPSQASFVNVHTQQPAVDRQNTHASSSSVNFLDITPHLMPPSTSTKKDCAHDTNAAPTDTAPVFSPACTDHDVSRGTAHDASSPLCAPPLCDRLDMFLPNGIRITLYQTGIDARTQLIKSLV
jgi:transposase-like protein